VCGGVGLGGVGCGGVVVWLVWWLWWCGVLCVVGVICEVWGVGLGGVWCGGCGPKKC
jgi:hypothetical protein